MKKTKIKKDLSNKLKEIDSGNKVRGITLISLVIILVIITNGVSIYAATTYLANNVSYTTNKNPTVKNVEDALNDLYAKKNEGFIENIESIWTVSAASINYKFTAERPGLYLIGIANCNKEGVKGTITSNCEIVKEQFLGNETAYGRMANFKLLNVKEGDEITITGYNGEVNASAFIYKLNNINVSTIVDSTLSTDATATVSYKANSDKESVLAVGVAFGGSTSNSITYDGIYYSQERKNGNSYIGYSLLNKDTTVTVSTYGYNWGGGLAIILK